MKHQLITSFMEYADLSMGAATADVLWTYVDEQLSESADQGTRKPVEVLNALVGKAAEISNLSHFYIMLKFGDYMVNQDAKRLAAARAQLQTIKSRPRRQHQDMAECGL